MKTSLNTLVSSFMILAVILMVPGNFYGVEESNMVEPKMEIIPSNHSELNPVESEGVYSEHTEPAQQNEMESLQNQQETLISQMEELKQSAVQQEEVVTVTKEQLEQEIAALEADIEAIQKSEEEKVYVLALQDDALTKAEELKRCEEQLAVKEQALIEAREAVAMYSDSAVIDTDRAIDEDHANILQTKNEIAQAQTELANAQSVLAARQAELDSANAAYQDQLNAVAQQQVVVDQAAAALSQAQFIYDGTQDDEVKAQAQANIDQANMELADAQSNYAVAQAAVAQAQQVVDVATQQVNAVQVQIAQLESQIASYQQQIETVKTNEVTKSGLTASLQSAQQALAKAEQDYNNAKAAVDAAKKAKEDADKKVTAINNELKTLKTKADNAQKTVDKGSLGYFQSMGYTDAANVLLGTDKSYRSQYASAYKTALSRTSIGAKNDATSLENLKKSLTVLQDLNTYRKQEKLSVLKVDPYLMAVCEIQTNWSSNQIAHSHIYNVGENLAWGYIDPFDGWYDKEKKIAQQHPEYMNQNHKNWSDVGHYWNIKQSRYAYQGAAVNQKSTDYIRTFGNTFNYTAHKTSVTVDAFAKSVNSYYNNLMKDIDAYQDALKTQTTLKNNATVKNNEYTTANNKYAQTNNALNTAKNNLVQVNDQIARKEKELEETNAQILWLKDQIAQTNADRQSLETVDYIQALIECDLAEAQLNDAQNNRYEKQQSVVAAQQNVALQEDILAQMYGSVESAYQTLLKQEAQYVAKTEVLNEKTDELNSRQAKVVLAQSKVDASVEEIRGTESTIDGLNHQLSAYQQQLTQDEERLAGLKQKRLTVSLLENDIEQLANRIVDLRMELNNTSSSQRSVMLHNMYVQISQVLRQA